MLVSEMDISPQLKQYYLRRKYYIFLLGNRCARCGSMKNLEFDHIVPSTKLYTISEMLSKSFPEESLHEELRKCQILCEDCHLKKTREEDGFKARHGTGGMYRHHGCRCEACKEANSSYYKAWKEKKQVK